MKIVVIGGTGLIGSQLVDRFRADGHEAVAASPASGVDAVTGEGLADVLKGASVVVDVSNSPSFEDKAVLEFFEKSTGNLAAAEADAGVGHHVALSIVGVERPNTIGYFRAKAVQEELIKRSPVPYSIVHATQFMEFAKGIADAGADGDTVRLAPVLFQPIAAEDVALAVGDVALGAPLNGTVDIAGPERFRLDEFIRRALKAFGDGREVVTDPQAGYYGAVVADDLLVPLGVARLGAVHFEDWAARSAGR